MSVGRTAAVSRGASASSTSSPAAWPSESLIELEAVDVEHEDRDVDAARAAGGPARCASRSSASVRFGRPVSGSCSAAWRVDLLVAVALDGDDDQRRDRGEERDLVLGERARLARADVEHPERLVVALDRRR